MRLVGSINQYNIGVIGAAENRNNKINLDPNAEIISELDLYDWFHIKVEIRVLQQCCQVPVLRSSAATSIVVSLCRLDVEESVRRLYMCDTKYVVGGVIRD